MKNSSLIWPWIGLVVSSFCLSMPARAQSNEELKAVTRIEVVNSETGVTSRFGTGIALGNDGDILTSRDVVSQADGSHLTYALFNGVRQRVQLSGCHTGSLDACLLKILDTSFSSIGVTEFPKLGCRTLNLFEEVQAAGFPAESSASLNRVRGDISTERTDSHSLFRTTAPVVQGMSGAPVFDRSGRIVGIVKLNPALSNNIPEVMLFTPLFKLRSLIGDTPHTCDDNYDPDVPAQPDVVAARPIQTVVICEGEFERRCRPYPYDFYVGCYQVDNKVAQICRDKPSERVSVRPSEGGNRCGYGWYRVSC